MISGDMHALDMDVVVLQAFDINRGDTPLAVINAIRIQARYTYVRMHAAASSQHDRAHRSLDPATSTGAVP